MKRALVALVWIPALVACGSTPSPEAPKCASNDACSGTPDTPVCEATSGKCMAVPRGGAIGWGNGKADSVTFTTIYEAKSKKRPVDLAFHPDRGELWVVSYDDNSVAIGFEPGTESARWDVRIDPAAQHFMHKPPALAMGTGNTWGVCGDNDNAQNGRGGVPNYFMGPSLMSADLSILAKSTPGGLGSHLDMLHGTPFCRGIAHEEGNAYWVFNAYDKSLDRYAFQADHGPGNDDHSDGEIKRYVAGQVRGVDGLPSHVFYDAEDKALYVADTGSKRILRFDPAGASAGGTMPRANETLKGGRSLMTGGRLDEIVPAGTLDEPVGMEVRGGLLYVTDTATSTIHAFDKTGAPVRSLETGLPPRSLAGLTFGPDGKVYFVDMQSARVLRVDPK
jgi:hypothetical protein